jgi:L-alanine-DL-glutamate epimerase-like enolase superfamily enzyme
MPRISTHQGPAPSDLKGNIHVIQVDLTRCAAFTEGMKIAVAAADHGLRFAKHEFTIDIKH